MRLSPPDRLGTTGLASYSEAKCNPGSESVHCLSYEMHSGNIVTPFREYLAPLRGPGWARKGWQLSCTQTFMRNPRFSGCSCLNALDNAEGRSFLTVINLFDDFVVSYCLRRKLKSGSLFGEKEEERKGRLQLAGRPTPIHSAVRKPLQSLRRLVPAYKNIS